MTSDELIAIHQELDQMNERLIEIRREIGYNHYASYPLGEAIGALAAFQGRLHSSIGIAAVEEAADA